MNIIDIRTTHSFNALLAEEIGVQKAILIKNIEYWVTENKRKEINFHDDEYWTFESSPQLAKKYPYMKASTIRRWMLDLEKEGWIKSGSYGKDVYDRTKWYTIGTKYLNWLDKYIIKNQTDQNNQSADKLDRSMTDQNEQSGVESERSLNVSILNQSINKQDIESLSFKDGRKIDDDDFKSLEKQYGEKYDIAALFQEARCRLDKRQQREPVDNAIGYLKTIVRNMLAEELENYSLEIIQQKEAEEEKENTIYQQQKLEEQKQKAEKMQIAKKIKQLKKERTGAVLRTPKKKDTNEYFKSLTTFQQKITRSKISTDPAFRNWFRSKEIGSEIDYLEKKLTAQEFEYYLSNPSSL